MTTTSAPHASPEPRGRPLDRPLDRGVDGAAAARTAELFAQHGRTVAGLCKALLRDRAEAEDAAQQTFLSAHRALLNGVEPREPAAWLATIARNECWARIKTRMREPLPTDAIEGVSSDDPVHAAIRRADLAALWRAIDALPKQQRDALLLREFGGLSYEELAAALAVSGPAVESLLFRARTRLRRQLRAAYASLTGAPWLEALARLFAGGSAPVAAKVAALGVGAAAVTGGAVVTPRVLVHHPAERPHPVPVRTVDRALPETPVVAPVAATTLRPAATVRPATAPKSASPPRESRRGSSGPGPGEDATRTQPAERHETETHERGEHVSGGAGEPERSGADGGADGGTDAESEGDGSGSGADDHSGSGGGGGPSDHSGEHSGGDDGGRSGHGGGDETVPTVTIPTVTQPGVTVPTDPSEGD